MRTLLIVGLLSSSFLSTLAWPRWKGGCISNQDCPPSHPDCSEEGYCQCAEDQPCWDKRGGAPATTYPAFPPSHPPSYTTLEAPSPSYTVPKAPPTPPPTDSYQEPSLSHIKQPEETSFLQSSPAPTSSPAPAPTPAPAPVTPPAPSLAPSSGPAPPAPSLAGSCKSNQDCPASHPICSEWDFCQSPSYKPPTPVPTPAQTPAPTPAPSQAPIYEASYTTSPPPPSPTSTSPEAPLEPSLAAFYEDLLAETYEKPASDFNDNEKYEELILLKIKANL